MDGSQHPMDYGPPPHHEDSSQMDQQQQHHQYHQQHFQNQTQPQQQQQQPMIISSPGASHGNSATAAAARRLKNGPITANACIACRKVKMKCIFEDGESTCKRCIRLKSECILEKHRRGRKVGTKLNRSHGKVTAQPPSSSSLPPTSSFASTPPPSALEQNLSSSFARPIELSTPLSLSHSHTPDVTTKTESPVLVDTSATFNNEQSTTSVAAETPGPDDNFRSTAASTGSGHSSSFWTKTKGFQAPDLLNEKATSGKFSLKTILSVEDEEVRPEINLNTTTAQQCAEDYQKDPILKGEISMAQAQNLFEQFMQKFNPWIAQFDPALHTFEYVRKKSTFLFTAVLAAAAKAFSPSLKKPLQELAKTLHAEAFMAGTKSTEIVHAILLLTYWKEPDDTRAWLMTGYIIRMCMELGWHQLPFTREDTEDGTPPREPTDLEIRQARDIERVWLVLFVYDRSISLQTGKPWMIERSDFIIDSNDWYQHHLATHNDKLLCGFVNLRLLTSETLKLVHPKFLYLWRGPRTGAMLESEFLLETLEKDLQRWKDHWHNICLTSPEKCHAFLIRFYGAHLRLSFNSIPLQPAMIGTMSMQAFDKRPLWVCFASAREMLHLLAEPEITPYLYFCQDSIHVMTAYSVAFLLKVCLSGNANSLNMNLQISVLDALKAVSAVFNAQKAAPDTGCALQAKFLDNVIREFENKAGPGLEAAVQYQKYQQQQQQQQQQQRQESKPSQIQNQQHQPPPVTQQSGFPPQYQQQQQQQQHEKLPQQTVDRSRFTQTQQFNSQPMHPMQQQQPQLMYQVPHQDGPPSASVGGWPPQQELPHMLRNNHASLNQNMESNNAMQQVTVPVMQGSINTMDANNQNGWGCQPLPNEQTNNMTMMNGYTKMGDPMQQQPQTDFFPAKDFMMTDNNIWETVMANAGFNVEQGIFMPMSINRP